MTAQWVQPGHGVAEGVAAAVVELQGDDRLGEVIIIVPPGSTAGTLRRLLPRVSGGVAGIRFLTPIDLAVELVDSTVSTMRAVTTQLQLAAITSVLSSDDCPAVLLGVRDHPATIDALVDMAVALRAAHVVPSALRSLAGDPQSVRAALIEVIVGARQRLTALGVRDESATLAALDDVDGAALAGLHVVVAVTDTFHPAQVPFLRRLAGQPSCRIVAVVPQPTDAALVHQLHAFGCGEPPQPRPAVAPQVISCPDPDEEVRDAVRRCARLIDRGVPADDIAIVCAAPAYRRPVRDELQRAGIAWSGGAVEKLRGSIAGQVLRHVVDGIVGEWDRPNVFRLLSVAPLYTLGDFGAPRRVGQWTSLCRRLGLVTEADWERADDALAAAHLDRRRHLARDTADPSPTAREIADAEALGRLLTLVSRLRVQSKRVRRATTWAEAVKGLHAMLDDHIGVATWRERAWAEGPAWQRNAADHVERIVAGLAEFDHDGIAMPFTPPTIRQVIGTLLDTPVRRRGDAAGAVSIADIGAAVCIDAAHVFVVGLNEGVLPAATTDDLLLGRDLPEAAAAVIDGPRASAGRAVRAWHALLHSDASVTATLARTDLRRGGEVYPSPLLAGMEIHHHQSHAVGLLDGDALTTSERLAAMSDSHLTSRRLARRAAALRARLDPQPTEFDGLVGPHPLLAPPGKLWSISAVERQAACGLAYFGQYVLGVSDETDAATIMSIEPAERGILVHAVFEQVAREWLSLGADQRQPWLQDDHLTTMHQRCIDVLDDLAASIGLQHRLGHASAWGAERAHILRSIEATLRAEAIEATQPVACEHSFSGVMVVGAEFGGKIDRIDLMPDGGLRVTDFKTGKAASVRNVLENGRKLQLPLYARAADHDRAVLLGDRPVATVVDPPPATARYLHVRDAKANARVVELDPELIAQFEAFVERWLDEIATGNFIPRPHPSNGRCLMCCVDSLGVEELAERARLFPGNAVADIDEGDE
ncbi:MAG: PD-(D/E)XK nuclease family protein [Ilumatobacteraceae bacterium]